MKRTSLLRAVCMTLGVGFAVAAHGPPEARASDEQAMRALEAIVGLDFDDARKELALADGSDPQVQLEKGRLALYEADCDAAALLLSKPEVTKIDEGGLGEMARGCARVIAATVVEKDEARQVEVRYQDAADRAFTSILADTVVKARDALSKDLAVTWPKPTRIIVVRDLLSLSAMTGLPYESAMTTGTVAVAKWGRVTLLSPRATPHGYPWRDTMAHELTHLAVTRASRDRAPLWLQEGVAKNEEVRWRAPGPMDDRPPPEAVVARGMELKLDIPLDKLGPSIAMLPSADAAMVAFAEVTSFVRHFVADQGPEALPKLLAALRDRKKPDEALQLVSGLDLQGWDARWRKALASISHDPEQLKSILRKSHQDHRDARERLRLAELLMGRGHWRSAEVQLGKVKGDDFAQDPTLRYLRVRAREALGERQDLLPVLGEPSTIVGGYGPWWGLRGRLLEGGGDFNGSGQAFFEALAVDPLDLEAACGTERTDIPPQQTAPQQRHPEEPSYGFLCEAARQRGEPPLGQD